MESGPSPSMPSGASDPSLKDASEVTVEDASKVTQPVNELGQPSQWLNGQQPGSDGGESAAPADGASAGEAPAAGSADGSDSGDGNAPSDGSQPPDGETPPPKSFWQRSKRWIMIGVPILVLLIAAVVIFFALRHQPAKPKPPATVNTQPLSPDVVKQLSQPGAIAGSLQTLEISPNSVFQNNITVQGQTSLASDLTVGGNLTVKGTSDLQGPVNADSSLTVKGPLNVGGTGSFAGNLTIAGSLTIATDLNVSSITAGNLTVNGTFYLAGHLAVAGASPTVTTSVATGNGSASLSGNDTAGTVNIITGSNPVSGELVIIKFRNPYPGTPKVQLTPVSLTAAGLRWYASQSATFFTIDTATAPAATTTYSFNYFVMQ